MDTRINLDGSPWDWLPMSFKTDPGLVADREQFSALCESIFRLTKGEVEFMATEKPCVMHRQDVWREMECIPDSAGNVTVAVYICCRQFKPNLAPSIPQLEKFIKRKLKLED